MPEEEKIEDEESNEDIGEESVEYYDEEESEELENIIEDSQPIPDFSRAALDEIIPTLSDRGETLEQGIENIQVTEQQKGEEQETQTVYEVPGERSPLSYDLGGDYQAMSGSYDTPTQTPNSSPEINRSFIGGTRIQEQFDQQQPGIAGIGQPGMNQQKSETPNFQQQSYDTDIEKRIKEERKRMF